MEKLREMIIRTIEQELTLKEFEKWLVAYTDTVPSMHEPIWYKLLSFDYDAKDAAYLFQGFQDFFTKDEQVITMINMWCDDILKGKDLYNSLYKLERFNHAMPNVRKITKYREALDNLWFGHGFKKSKIVSSLQKDARKFITCLNNKTRLEQLRFLRIMPKNSGLNTNWLQTILFFWKKREYSTTI